MVQQHDWEDRHEIDDGEAEHFHRVAVFHGAQQHHRLIDENTAERRRPTKINPAAEPCGHRQQRRDEEHQGI